VHSITAAAIPQLGKTTDQTYPTRLATSTSRSKVGRSNASARWLWLPFSCAVGGGPAQSERLLAAGDSLQQLPRIRVVTSGPHRRQFSQVYDRSKVAERPTAAPMHKLPIGVKALKGIIDLGVRRHHLHRLTSALTSSEGDIPAEMPEGRSALWRRQC